MVKINSWQDYCDLPETKWKIKQPADNDIRPDALDTGLESLKKKNSLKMPKA